VSINITAKNRLLVSIQRNATEKQAFFQVTVMTVTVIAVTVMRVTVDIRPIRNCHDLKVMQ
jgi:hypothetical protein